MTQNEFKVISQQMVAQVRKEAKKLEGDKQRLAVALKKSEGTCAKVSKFTFFSEAMAYSNFVLSKLSDELSSLKVKYEALSTKYELTVQEQGKQLDKTHSALQETEHVSYERIKIIDQLETTNAELVREMILVISVASFEITLIQYTAGIPQESTSVQIRESRQ